MTREKKKQIIFDATLVAALLLISLVAFLICRFALEDGAAPSEGAVVVVTLDGEVVAEYPLFEDGEYSPTATNRITIKGGEVYMSYSTCPGYQDCVEYGAISTVGGVNDMIVCAPNRVSVYIEER